MFELGHFFKMENNNYEEIDSDEEYVDYFTW
jgi:hypothetical protein